MAAHNPITKLTSRGESFDLGATFDHVYLSEDNDFALGDLYKHYTDFLNSNLFVAYKDSAPTADNVNVWYDTTETDI